jgi:FkbM family methyltransferase
MIRLLPEKYELPGTYYKYRTIGMFDEEILMLPKLITKGSVAVDIGANIGLYSYVLSKLFDTVEAFEPVPDSRRILQAYNAKNINVHNAALSSAEGQATLNIPTENNVTIYSHASLSNEFPSQKKIQVPIRKLDDYNFVDVNFIKIDVEGHELDVIRGAKRTILRWRPIMLIEIEQRHLSFPINTVFEEIIACGYKGFFLYHNKLHPLTDFSIEHHQKTDLGQNHKGRRKYVNNFIFIPDNKSTQIQQHFGMSAQPSPMRV